MVVMEAVQAHVPVRLVAVAVVDKLVVVVVDHTVEVLLIL